MHRLGSGICALALMAGTLCIGAPGLADDCSPAPCPPASAACPPDGNSCPSCADCDTGGGWDFKITPYFWLTRNRGNASIGEHKGAINTTYDDFSKYFGGGGFFYFEAQKGRWVYFVDFKSRVLGNRILEDNPLETKLDFQQLTVDLGAMRLHDKGNWIIAPVYGARYQRWRIKLQPLDQVIAERVWWPEPFVGLYARHDFDEKTYFSARGDGGIFQLDRGTIIWFNGKTEIGYEWFENSNIVLGYQTHKYDYDGKRGGLQLRVDGPYLGVSFDL